MLSSLKVLSCNAIAASGIFILPKLNPKIFKSFSLSKPKKALTTGNKTIKPIKLISGAK